jgi:hypothetical protein
MSERVSQASVKHVRRAPRGVVNVSPELGRFRRISSRVRSVTAWR